MGKNLLEEAIAEAKLVKKVAYENAKATLEEAFEPQIQKLLSTEIKEEDGEEEYSEEEPETEEEPTDDEVEFEESVHEGDDEEFEEEPTEDDEELYSEPEDGGEEGDSEDTEFGDDEVEEENIEIESILDELEAEVDGEEGEMEEPTFDDDEEESEEEPEMEESKEDPTNAKELDPQLANESDDNDEDDEDVDLTELLKSLSEDEQPLEEEEYPGDDGTENKDHEEQNVVKKLEGIKAENIRLKKRLSDTEKALRFTKSSMAEVNLLNNKLLYSMKLFKDFKLNNESRSKIIEQFDRTKSVREIKLVYATIYESLKGKPERTNKTSLKEAIKKGTGASKSVGGTKPKNEEVIVEGNQFKDRMKKLANII